MEPLTLYDINALVRQELEKGFPSELWLQAELSDVRSTSNGHCYLEFVQKDSLNNSLIAKARGTIWSNVFKILRPYFEKATGQTFTSGIKVLVQVQINFHELYGYSLTVTDIDPTYTMGDMALRRKEILKQLEADGILTLNKELPMPLLPQRIAIISSATAAGYGDFCNQLQQNPYGYYFYTELFTAWMQGEQVEASILNALEAIQNRIDEFDVIVIIRGGGATSDLACFDNYLLAAACAQFPLPIITGIGHERDETVLDSVAHIRVKTPTAAAELLIQHMDEAAFRLDSLGSRLREGVIHRLQSENNRLEVLKNRMPQTVIKQLSEARLSLMSKQMQLSISTANLINSEQHKLELLQQRIADASPEKLLKRGYSITLVNGKVVKDASQLKTNDILTTLLQHGEIKSKVIQQP